MKSKNPIRIVIPSACLLLAIASPSVRAAVTQFTFLNGMTGANESTPNASTAIGTINVLQFDDSVGALGTLTIDITFTGLTSSAQASHIHLAAPGVNGPVLFALGFTSATSGTITGTWAPANAENRASLFSGGTYINLHSEAFPGGEIRGQLVAVPEPSAALLGALGGFALLRRRRY